MAKVDLARLPALVTSISASLSELEAGRPSHEDWEAWKVHRGKYRALIADLETKEGATYRAGVASAYHLRLAGIATSCTGGEEGLLRNWITAARRWLDAEQVAA